MHAHALAQRDCLCHGLHGQCNDALLWQPRCSVQVRVQGRALQNKVANTRCIFATYFWHGIAWPGVEVSVLNCTIFLLSCTMTFPLRTRMHAGITHHCSVVMTQDKIIDAAMPHRKCVEKKFFFVWLKLKEGDKTLLSHTYSLADMCFPTMG